MSPPLVVGISGASGAIYGVRLLQALDDGKIPAYLIISKSATQTLNEETDLSVGDVRALAEVTYQNTDLGAAISSGSFKTRGASHVLMRAPSEKRQGVRRIQASYLFLPVLSLGIDLGPIAAQFFSVIVARRPQLRAVAWGADRAAQGST